MKLKSWSHVSSESLNLDSSLIMNSSDLPLLSRWPSTSPLTPRTAETSRSITSLKHVYFTCFYKGLLPLLSPDVFVRRYLNITRSSWVQAFRNTNTFSWKCYFGSKLFTFKKWQEIAEGSKFKLTDWNVLLKTAGDSALTEELQVELCLQLRFCLFVLLSWRITKITPSSVLKCVNESRRFGWEISW